MSVFSTFPIFSLCLWSPSWKAGRTCFTPLRGRGGVKAYVLRHTCERAQRRLGRPIGSPAALLMMTFAQDTNNNTILG